MKRNPVDRTRLAVCGIINRTRHDGGATEFFPRGRRARYVVGDGDAGFTMSRAEFYGSRTPADGRSIHTRLAEALPGWLAAGYDGFGTWDDADGTGLIYVDPVTTHDDAGAALYIGGLRGELAVFDRERGECLNVPAEARARAVTTRTTAAR